MSGGGLDDSRAILRRIAIVPSPIGDLSAVFVGGNLLELRFDRADGTALADDAGTEITPAGDSVADDLRRWLGAYFEGRDPGSPVPLAPRGTEFQAAVWRAVGRIPYGTTRTYRDIAEQLGSPGSVRAVGTANGANPWPLLVPCHRVVGVGGALTGYSGGLDRKHWLLRHEGALLV